jgi:hypothetical protein
MPRTLTILAAALLCSAAFVFVPTVPGGLTVPVMVGPNSVMHSKALPNDNTIHNPYLPWTGTANVDVLSAGQTVIKKGDALGGMWGGRRASSTNLGELIITLTSVNGQNVVAGRHSQVGSGAGQDTWVAAGAVISFMTCTALNDVGGCKTLDPAQKSCIDTGGSLVGASDVCVCPAGKKPSAAGCVPTLTPNQLACTSSGGTLTHNGTRCSCPAGKIYSNGSGGDVLNDAVCLDGPEFYRRACTNSGGTWASGKCTCPAGKALNADGTCGDAPAAPPAGNIPAGLTVPVMVGPNSVMHTKALPNDNRVHPPYLPWTGTANADVVSSGLRVIKKGDALGGMWGGRRATSTSQGELLVTLTSVNGQHVVTGHYSQAGTGVGQDTWVSAGALVSFTTVP